MRAPKRIDWSDLMRRKEEKPIALEGETQETVRRLCDMGFQVIIYGADDAITADRMLAFTHVDGVTILNREEDIEIHRRKIALLSPGGRSDASFSRFVTRFLTLNLGRIYELRILNSSHPENEERFHAATAVAARSERYGRRPA